ncbi:MAG: HAMP domain-containing sensor histidine kinase [Planctomycetota bacterium]|nr:HAMP domain-containing sensor histidine kinase [Planctomycetota bacterium]
MRLATRLALTLLVTALPLTVGLVFLRERAARSAELDALVDYARGRMESGGREACEDAPEIFQDPPFRLPGDRRFGGPAPRDPLGLGRGPGGPGPDGPNAPAGAGGARPLRGRGPDFQQPPGRAEPAGPAAARFELWAYNPDFRSDNPAAPALEPALRAALERGAVLASGTFELPGRNGLPPRGGLQAVLRMAWTDGPCAIVLARRIDLPAEGSLLLARFGLPALLATLLVLVTLFAFLPFVRRVRALTAGVRRSAASGYVDPVGASGSDELTELGRAFDTAGAQVREQIERLERRERSLRAFVENTTHDVMLPLTVLQGHLVALERRAAANEVPDPSRVREAQEEAHYLGALLENLGAAARLEADELPIERHRMSLNRLIERAVGRQTTIARGKGVELVHALPGEEVEVEADVTLFERAVSNLVHNAVRYGREGGHVAVVLEVEGDEFVVRVLDDGPGVSDEELARLHERSYRTESARRRHPTGTGLGLSIAKEVCERHGFGFQLRRAEVGGLEAILRGPRAKPGGGNRSTA